MLQFVSTDPVVVVLYRCWKCVDWRAVPVWKEAETVCNYSAGAALWKLASLLARRVAVRFGHGVYALLSHANSSHSQIWSAADMLLHILVCLLDAAFKTCFGSVILFSFAPTIQEYGVTLCFVCVLCFACPQSRYICKGSYFVCCCRTWVTRVLASHEQL